MNWEPESVRWYRTALLGSEFLKAASKAQDVDFSPAVACWPKALERELALSVGHFVRRELGIDLPKFFDLHQPDKRCPCDKAGCDFNLRGPGGRWRSPELGRMRSAVRSRKGGIPHQQLRVQDLLREWATVQKLRNEACHSTAWTMLERGTS